MAVSTLLPNSLFVDANAASNYYLEDDRLASFEGWPLPYLSPIELAKAGFYYTKNADIVRCPFCSVELSKWEPGDDVVSDHERWAPQCVFVRCVLKNDTNAGAGEDVCGNFNSMYTPDVKPEHNAILSGLENLTVAYKKTKFPEYAIYESRLKTFEHWPKALKQRPEQLAEAGFFYGGNGDRCVCFHCGGGLNNWEPEDTPWEQHAYWFRKCNFVLLKKNYPYVDQVVKKIDSKATREEDEQPQPPPTTTQTKENDYTTTTNRFLCKICYSNKDDHGVLFLPCSHVAACPDCASTVTSCPFCRTEITSYVPAFLS